MEHGGKPPSGGQKKRGKGRTKPKGKGRAKLSENVDENHGVTEEYRDKPGTSTEVGPKKTDEKRRESGSKEESGSEEENGSEEESGLEKKGTKKNDGDSTKSTHEVIKPGGNDSSTLSKYVCSQGVYMC